MTDFTSLEELIMNYREKKGLSATSLSAQEVSERVNDTILESIPDEKLEEFEQLLDEKNDEKMMSFLKAEVPNLESIITDILG